MASRGGTDQGPRSYHKRASESINNHPESQKFWDSRGVANGRSWWAGTSAPIGSGGSQTRQGRKGLLQHVPTRADAGVVQVGGGEMNPPRLAVALLEKSIDDRLQAGDTVVALVDSSATDELLQLFDRRET